MSLYDAMKDAIKIAQQADNIELYRQLLDLSSQALDLQVDLANLKEENRRLHSELTLKRNVVRHKGAFVTLADDAEDIAYCAICYAKTDKMFQLMEYSDTQYYCYNCGKYIYKE